MSIRAIWNWHHSKDPQHKASIAELAQHARHYRHPDSAHIAYPLVVQDTLGVLPQRNYRIGIIGAGSAGTVALFELARLAQQLSAPHRMQVSLFDMDPLHFLAPQPTKQDVSPIHTRKAGRVWAARVATDAATGVQTDRTIYEVGAMRFPETAGLIWHYASQVYEPATRLSVFPNPGKVATEFVFGADTERYNHTHWDNPECTTRQLLRLILRYLPGIDLDTGKPTHVARFKIGDRDPFAVSALLASPSSNETVLTQIEQDWQAFIAQYDGTTLASAGRQIIEHASAQGELPYIPGLDPQETINHCVELFGRFGFGTGGFKPLFGISLVEMMRLILWNFSNEYSLPSEENSDFIERLYRHALELGGANFAVEFISARVSDAYHHHAPTSTKRQAALSYYLNTAKTPVLEESEFDYIILALPQTQLIPIITRAGYSPNGRDETRLGDAGLGLPTEWRKEVYNALQLSVENDAPTARIISAISLLPMVRASKVFGLIRNEDAQSANVPTVQGQPVQAVISDSGLAASYIVPSPIPGQPYSSFLASYTWNDDSTRLQRDFGHYPQNSQDHPGVFSPDQMFTSMINRATRDIYDPETNSYRRWWLGDILNKVQTDSRFVFDWSTARSAGAFKLDNPGDHYHSNLCFRFHTHARSPSLNNRFFLACDSYSHLGGWLEGAFMSAINAVSGVLVAANGGDVGALNKQAQKLFTTLHNLDTH